MRNVTLDLRPRCKRCKKIPRGKMQVANFARNKPYCSFSCQEWGRLEDAQRYINTLNAAAYHGDIDGDLEGYDGA